MLEILDSFFFLFFDMSSDVQAFEVRVFTSDFEFWIGIDEYQ